MVTVTLTPLICFILLLLAYLITIFYKKLGLRQKANVPDDSVNKNKTRSVDIDSEDDMDDFTSKIHAEESHRASNNIIYLFLLLSFLVLVSTSTALFHFFKCQEVCVCMLV